MKVDLMRRKKIRNIESSYKDFDAQSITQEKNLGDLFVLLYDISESNDFHKQDSQKSSNTTSNTKQLSGHL